MFLSIKKMFITTSLCLSFLVLFGFSVYAESDDFSVGELTEETSKDEVLDYFNWTDDSLIDFVETKEVESFASPSFGAFELEVYRSETVKDLGPLQITSGFNRERLTTFSSTKTITGIGEEGAVVGLHVFYIDMVTNTEEEYIVSTQDSLVTLGKSGLYNQTVCFSNVGVNYVLITVEDPVTLAKTKKLFKVTLKEIETRNKLENMTINFFEETVESPSIETFVPEIVNFGF